jgi:hypothetical protein
MRYRKLIKNIRSSLLRRMSLVVEDPPSTDAGDDPTWSNSLVAMRESMQIYDAAQLEEGLTRNFSVTQEDAFGKRCDFKYAGDYALCIVSSKSSWCRILCTGRIERSACSICLQTLQRRSRMWKCLHCCGRAHVACLAKWLSENRGPNARLCETCVRCLKEVCVLKKQLSI